MTNDSPAIQTSTVLPVSSAHVRRIARRSTSHTSPWQLEGAKSAEQRPAAVDWRLRWKAIGCLSLVLAVIVTGLMHILWHDGAEAGIPPAPIPVPLAAHLSLPGAAVRIPEVPIPGAVVSPSLTIFLRAALNCPAPDRAAAEARRLVSLGVRRVMLQCKQDETDEREGGVLFFPSAVAAVAAEFEDGRLIRFAQALAAEGVEVCAWVPLFNDASAAAAHHDWRALTYSDAQGITEREGWLCPRHPQVLAYEGAIVRAAIEAGGGVFRGVYLDFIRFDDDLSCVCEACLSATAARAGRRHVLARELPAAGSSHSALWKAWTASRGDAIGAAANAMRDAIEPVAPDLWLAACVLPFSAKSYALNTQSGQDLRKLCRAGLDEIMLMGYWDDWDLSPQWLAESRDAAEKTTRGEARLTCVIDGDMSVARTMTTLAALGRKGEAPAYFHYGRWTDETLAALHHARARLSSPDDQRRAEFTAVCIRIDTEPDFRKSYAAVSPGMIHKLTRLFAEEKVQATFATCGRLAELQPEAIRDAAALGHEIAVHAYDHEQIDSLPENEQIAVIDHSLAVFRQLGIPIWGFAAPRNSITAAARDRLIEHGLLWDGSAAFDPHTAWLNAEPVAATHDPHAGIVVLPFTTPNDWDARYLDDLSATEMADRWLANLQHAAEVGDATFIIDIHQWIAALDDNLEALRRFIRGAKQTPRCRVVTVREAALHVLRETRRADGLAWQWSDTPAAPPR